MRFAAVKSGNLVAAAQCISNLIWPSEPSAAKNENAQRFRGFLCEQRCRSGGQGKGATSRSREFDKFTTRCFHVASYPFLSFRAKSRNLLLLSLEIRDDPRPSHEATAWQTTSLEATTERTTK